MINIISWNVNGIRAGFKKGTMQEIFNLKPDIFCIQETKAEISQLSEEQKNVPNYSCFMHSSEERKGYSGVAIYTKETPQEVERGIKKGVSQFDFQGRVITLYFENFIVVNAYLPNGGRNQERLSYKLEFYELFQLHIENLDEYGLPVIVVGDFNVAHTEIDIARAKPNMTSTGFLPVERAWIGGLLSSGWVDLFRHFNPGAEDCYTYWDQITRARERNVGWRIDYALAQSSSIEVIKSTAHLTDQFGSDHCPVKVTLQGFT